jgi:DUF1680 family protein
LDVNVESRFWTERLDVVNRVTVPSQHGKLAEMGTLESLKLPNPPPPLRFARELNGFTVQYFWDADVGKWIEAAAYSLHHCRDPETEAQVDAIVEDFGKAQLPDGYLDCWYIGREADRRWSNLRDNHELLNAGHMLEGAIAYFEVTGKRRWLDIMERYLDHIRDVFGPGPGQKPGYDGHEEIELALVKLYRLTGEKKHLDLATFFINERGRQNPHFFDVERKERSAKGWDTQPPTQNYEYSQTHKPVREQTQVVGHAVRAMHLYTAMADLALELRDEGLTRACEALWRDLTESKLYVTGGIGPAAHNEGFTTRFDLPNQTAYAETCASIGLVLWAQRMLHLKMDGRYADVMELALFNGALAGLSRDGKRYFYTNPLESDGTASRWEWHTCPCCTTNIARLIGSVAGHFVSSAPDGIAFHLYGGVSTTCQIAGRNVRFSEKSSYPWSGDIAISVSVERPVEFDVRLRVPGWCESHSLFVNGNRVGTSPVDGYLTIKREWKGGDEIRLSLEMPVERLYANPAVIADAGRVALKRGPLVYCIEEADNAGGHVQRLRLPANASIAPVDRPDLFGGIVALTSADATSIGESRSTELYSTTAPSYEPAALTAIPYYLWANRQPGTMLVWIPEGPPVGAK